MDVIAPPGLSRIDDSTLCAERGGTALLSGLVTGRGGSWFNPTMYVIIWRYSVERAKEAEFRAAYGSDGEWARLFSSSPGFRGVELLALADAGEHVTIDRWATERDFRAFMAEHGQDYAALDERLADLTLSEDFVGRGEIVEESPD